MTSLESKIDRILETQNEMKIELAKHLIHQENHSKILMSHDGKFMGYDKDIKTLTAHKDKTLGFSAAISVVITAFGHAISKLF